MPSNKKRGTIVNPLTGRRIQVGGATYKRLMRSQRGKGGKQVAKTQRALDTISEFVRGSTMCPPSERCSRRRTRTHPVPTGRSCSLGNILSQAGQRPRTTATCWRRIESVLAPQVGNFMVFVRTRLAPFMQEQSSTYTTLDRNGKPRVPLSVSDLLDEAKVHLLPSYLRGLATVDHYLFLVLVENLGDSIFKYWNETGGISYMLDREPARHDDWIIRNAYLLRQSAAILARGDSDMHDFAIVVAAYVDSDMHGHITSVVAAIDLSKARKLRETIDQMKMYMQ